MIQRPKTHNRLPPSFPRARGGRIGSSPEATAGGRRRGARRGPGQTDKMNAFRLAGDMTHLMSVLLLLLKIHTIKSCAAGDKQFETAAALRCEREKVSEDWERRRWVMNDRNCVSLKTQELYALVFTTRYLDIFTDFISLYNTIMKLIFLGSSFSIVWYMRRHKMVRRSYDKDHDTFRHQFLILPCLILALLIHEKFTFREVLYHTSFSELLHSVMWTFSIYLEAVAIFPQLVLLQRTRNIDNLTGQYVFFLGAYRLLYILNWIYRYFTEPNYVHWITWISGLVQTLLYADFFYYYFNSWKNNVKLTLPA
ncbi:hypothetical protein EJB05_37316, partial [Eragrostis curvula]